MARPITAPELVNLRKDRQYSTLRASIIAPAQIWQGTVNQTFASYDMVTQITYTTTSGSTANIKPGMTLLVGSSTTGAAMWDAGQTRIRKVPAGGKLNIAETSDIAFNGKVLTVIEEFLPWPRHPRVTSSVVKMDWDVAYSDQNTDFTPVAIWGSDRVAEQLLPAGISLAFDASGSYCTGSTITGYAFACAGATITGGTTATPSILFPAPATYMVYLTLTAANGKTCVSSRVVDIYAQNDIVVDENTTIPARPAAQVKLDSCSGDWMAGGWTFDLTMVSGVDLVTVRPRARVILFAEDYYGSTKTSIGPLLGSENIIAIGWIGTQSTDINVAASSVSFTVYGAYYWIDQESSFPLGIRNIAGAANAWINIHDLTVDKMLVNTLIWRTTLTGIVDCYLTGDTRKASELATQGGSIWAQLVNIAEPTILARPCCDRYSRLYIEINTQYLASKAGVPVVMSPTKGDDSAEFTFEKRLTAQTSQLRISGVYYNGTTAKAIFSLSPGHTPKQYGAWRNQDYLLLASAQATANNLCGDMMGVDNNPYPSITVNFRQNNRMFDVCPQQFAYLDIAAADNVRGEGYTGNAIPRSVSYTHDESAALLATVNFEAETVREIARKGDLPSGENLPETPLPPIIPIVIDIPLPPIPETPTPASRINRVIVRDYNKGIFYTDTFPDASPQWLTANFGLPVAPTYIDTFLVTGLKNMVVSYGYLYEDEETYPQSGLWTAAPGGTFQKILSWSDLATTLGAITTIKIWVAVSPFDDTIAVLAHSATKAEGNGKIFIGTSAGGFVTGATLPRYVETAWPHTSFGYGDGQWRLFSQESSMGYYSYALRFSLDGSTITYDSGETLPLLPLASNPQSNFNSGPLFALPVLGQYSVDNGTNLLDFAALPSTLQSAYAQALAGDPTGTILMWASYEPLSINGGASWGAFAAFPGTPYYARFFYYPPSIDGLNEWLANIPNYGFNTVWIANSVDNGVTWLDRTGDFILVANFVGVEKPDLQEIYGI